MAKPSYGRVNNVSSSSSSSSFSSRPTCLPSPALLSALALIASTAPHAVAGGPLPHPTHPPAFLCPFIERDIASLSPRRPVDTPFSPQCSVIADRYVQGSDSLWRKTDSWTLYGSTCASRSSPSTSTRQSRPSASQTPTPPSALEFDTSILPAGWDNLPPVTPTTESTIILALAIVLAGSICIFMIACVIWRRRRKKARDPECRLAHNRNIHQDDGRENDIRERMRMWAKATARWKSNVRHSARRRRKKHILSPPLDHPPSQSPSGSPPPSLLVLSAPSCRNSVVFQEPDPSTPDTVLAQGSVSQPHPPSPPTYRASVIPTATSDSSLRPRLSLCNSRPFLVDDRPLPYIPPHDGHVAIDDKSHLAHIRELASSPPITAGLPDVLATQSISAPEWHEVDVDSADLGHVLTSCHGFEIPPSFPPPPSKADLPPSFGYLDDHSFRYGEACDILISLPVPGSPGPSPDAFPSAPPPIDDLGLEPSAPYLESEDELFRDWDRASYVPEVSPSADPISTPPGAIEPSISSTVSSSSRTAISSIPESAARDGILPRYHP